jgi:hypothetical protein
MAKKNGNLEALEKIEAEKVKEQQVVDMSEESDIDMKNFDEDNKPNILDGFIILETSEIPQEGALYPESWKFAYRCPTSKEIANFSTINEADQPAIIAAIEDLIRKCVVIFDTNTNKQISSGQINDAHRTFFLLKLREQYLPGSPISYTSMCLLCKESMEVNLISKKLKYPELSEKLINAFDGRKFVLDMGLEEPISFLIPTIEISSRIFKYIVKVYRDNQNDREKKEDKIVYDKQFLLLASYLYERGNESIKELSIKYIQIQKDEKKFKAYLEIATKMKLDNFDWIDETCGNCGSEEETQIRFPGGWKNMFVNKSDDKGYFGG